MRVLKLFIACSIVLLIFPSAAQVQTNVPEPVAGAKPVAVEHIKQTLLWRGATRVWELSALLSFRRKTRLRL